MMSGEDKGKHSLCFACDEPSNVWLDSDHRRSAEYCFQCFCMQSTWEDAREVFFNKPDMVQLLRLKLIAGRMSDKNRELLQWDKFYGTMSHKDMMDPDWFPELHEICHLAE